MDGVAPRTRDNQRDATPKATGLRSTLSFFLKVGLPSFNASVMSTIPHKAAILPLGRLHRLPKHLLPLLRHDGQTLIGALTPPAMSYAAKALIATLWE